MLRHGSKEEENWFAVNPDFPADDGTGSTAQPSSVNVSAYNPANNGLGIYLPPNSSGATMEYPTRGSIRGIQNTDNSSDTLNAGGFEITITGSIYHFSLAGSYVGQTYGTIWCYAGGTNAYDLANTFNMYAYFEGELEDGSDNI